MRSLIAAMSATWIWASAHATCEDAMLARRNPGVRIEVREGAHGAIRGVFNDDRPVLDVVPGGGAHPGLLALHWSGRLTARRAHDFLSRIFPTPGRPNLIFTYRDDFTSEFAFAGVPKMGRLYWRILLHNARNLGQLISFQEGELRVRVEGADGPLRRVFLAGDLNHVGAKDDEVEFEAERDEQLEAIAATTDPRERERLRALLAGWERREALRTPAMVMLQIDESLVHHRDFRSAVAGLIAATAEDPALFNWPAEVVEAIRVRLAESHQRERATPSK